METGAGKDALDGLHVLDLSREMAGPFCRMRLADMGAGAPGMEDQTHCVMRYRMSGKNGSASVALHHTLRSTALDPTSPAARDVLDRSVEGAGKGAGL